MMSSLLGGGDGGGSSGLTVGATAISGGTSGSALIDNAGVLGETPIRTILTGNLSLYVNASTGSDSYNGLSATYTGGVNGPWATFAKANAYVGALDFNGYVVITNFVAGAYGGVALCAPFSSSQGQNGVPVAWVIQGDPSDITLVSFTEIPSGEVDGAIGIIFITPPSLVPYILKNCTIDGTSLSEDTIVVFASGGGTFFAIGDGGSYGPSNGVKCIGTTGDFLTAGNGATLSLSDNITMTGSPNVWIRATQNGFVSIGYDFSAANFLFESPTGPFASAGSFPDVDFNAVIQFESATFTDVTGDYSSAVNWSVNGQNSYLDVFGLGSSPVALLGPGGFLGGGGAYLYQDAIGNDRFQHANEEVLAVQLSAPPTTTDLSAGFYNVFKDTVGGDVYLAYNDAGTIKKVTLV
jgi:hypothetical protein